MTDEVAITTKAKENLVFIIATLDLETRVNLSYTKNEFIRMCSFNGKQCDIEKYASLSLPDKPLTAPAAGDSHCRLICSISLAISLYTSIRLMATATRSTSILRRTGLVVGLAPCTVSTVWLRRAFCVVKCFHSLGLRVLVYSNVSDYMPTTEAAGVRIQIHGHNDQPFPDTFGQNAPTGFISSFGIKLVS